MILFDNGSDKHVCGLGVAPAAPTKNTTNTGTMRDAQGNVIPHTFQRDVSIKMRSDNGEIPGRAIFEVANVPGAILSTGNLMQESFRAVLAVHGSYLERGDRRVDLVRMRTTTS